jgi:hypothetical protein
MCSHTRVSVVKVPTKLQNHGFLLQKKLSDMSLLSSNIYSSRKLKSWRLFVTSIISTLICAWNAMRCNYEVAILLSNINFTFYPVYRLTYYTGGN